jgi:hypothetical protein
MASYDASGCRGSVQNVPELTAGYRNEKQILCFYDRWANKPSEFCTAIDADAEVEPNGVLLLMQPFVDEAVTATCATADRKQSAVERYVSMTQVLRSTVRQFIGHR